MIAKVCDRESRRDTWLENRLVVLDLYIYENIKSSVIRFKLDVVVMDRNISVSFRYLVCPVLH